MIRREELLSPQEKRDMEKRHQFRILKIELKYARNNLQADKMRAFRDLEIQTR